MLSDLHQLKSTTLRQPSGGGLFVDELPVGELKLRVVGSDCHGPKLSGLAYVESTDCTFVVVVSSERYAAFPDDDYRFLHLLNAWLLGGPDDLVDSWPLDRTLSYLNDLYCRHGDAMSPYVPRVALLRIPKSGNTFTIASTGSPMVRMTDSVTGVQEATPTLGMFHTSMMPDSPSIYWGENQIEVRPDERILFLPTRLWYIPQHRLAGDAQGWEYLPPATEQELYATQMLEAIINRESNYCVGAAAVSSLANCMNFSACEQSGESIAAGLLAAEKITYLHDERRLRTDFRSRQGKPIDRSVKKRFEVLVDESRKLVCSEDELRVMDAIAALSPRIGVVEEAEKGIVNVEFKDIVVQSYPSKPDQVLLMIERASE